MVSFIWKVHYLNQKYSEEFYLVTLKGFETFGPKLNSLFQISPRNIGQFVLRCQKGYKFQILLVSFVSKVHYFNQKLSQEFYAVTLKGFGTFGLKLNADFQINFQKIVDLFRTAKKASNFKFYWFLLYQKYITWTKTFHRSFV